MDTKHTPTPWRLILGPIQIVTDNKVIATMNHKLLTGGIAESLENARYVVTAVNAHEELVATLKHLLLKDGSDLVERAKAELFRHAPELRLMIEQAIAKSEGK